MYKYSDFIELEMVVKLKMNGGWDRAGFSFNVPGALKSLSWSYSVFSGGSRATRGIVFRPEREPPFLVRHRLLLYDDTEVNIVYLHDIDYYELIDIIRGYRRAAAIRAASFGRYMVPVDYPCLYPAMLLVLANAMGDWNEVTSLLSLCADGIDEDERQHVLEYFAGFARLAATKLLGFDDAVRVYRALDEAMEAFLGFIRAERGELDPEELYDKKVEAANRIVEALGSPAVEKLLEEAASLVDTEAPVVEARGGRLRITTVDCRALTEEAARCIRESAPDLCGCAIYACL